MFGLTGNSGLANMPGSGVQSYYFELLYYSTPNVQSNAPTTWSSIATSWKDTGFSGVNSATASRMAGNPAVAGATVPWSTGTSDSIVVVGWSGNLGTSWLSVSNNLANWSTAQQTVVGNAFFGETPAGYISTFATTTSPGATVFGAAFPLIVGAGSQLYLLPVPEPATFALIGLGGLSLLLFRRRQ